MIYNIQCINKLTNQPANWYINAPNVFAAMGIVAQLLAFPDNYDLVYAVPYNQD